MYKTALRQYIRRKKAATTEAFRRAEDVEIARRLLSLDIINKAQTILMYWSLPDEVATHDITTALRRQRKTVLLPCVTATGEMELRMFGDENDMTADSYGILCPQGTAFRDYLNIDVAVVPGIAFDSHNNRLGRGKGFYDRLLPLLPNAFKIGLAYSFQLVDTINTDIHDVPMNIVLSANAIVTHRK